MDKNGVIFLRCNHFFLLSLGIIVCIFPVQKDLGTQLNIPTKLNELPILLSYFISNDVMEAPYLPSVNLVFTLESTHLLRTLKALVCVQLLSYRKLPQGKNGINLEGV